jgi:hypothetical protein
LAAVGVAARTIAHLLLRSRIGLPHRLRRLRIRRGCVLLPGFG